MTCKPRQLNKFFSLASVSLGGLLSFSAFSIYRGDETIYSKILMPFVSKYVDPETAHGMCLFLTKYKLIKCQDKLTTEQANKLKIKILNLSFPNPIGLAAGFDKNSSAIDGLPYYGLGFAEVGTVTPRPQDGNPKRRIFRINEDKALINRCGFNNRGIDFVRKNLSGKQSLEPMIVGLNLGKNKDTDHLSSDYVIGLEKSKDIGLIDYIVINISSPNTPGLRDSQEKRKLESLLEDVLSSMNKLGITKPLLIKVAPDLSKEQIKDIADVIMKKSCQSTKVSGIILTNTTLTRPHGSSEPSYQEFGGLSGKPLRDLSTQVISDFYKLTKGCLPIIGVGGVSSGQDAYEKIRAGASLVQLYTGLTYEGPPVVNKIKRELAELLERDKIESVSDAVGIDHRKKSN